MTNKVIKFRAWAESSFNQIFEDCCKKRTDKYGRDFCEYQGDEYFKNYNEWHEAQDNYLDEILPINWKESEVKEKIMIYKGFSVCDGLYSSDFGKKILDIMQFTGLFDKNGKEIYELDIVEYKDLGTGELKKGWIEEYRWSNNGRCQYGLHICQNSYFNGKNNKERTPIDNPNDIKIIGNIYENPDLINKK